jgi:NADP-dependent 3-hydroxy acid dehydrogenase YdfG
MPKQIFKDKISIVTGASSGIGRATAITLAAHGAHVALAARREQMLWQVAEEIQASGRQALVIPTDVTHQDQCNRLIQTVIDRWGRIDILVANAGEYVRSPVFDLSADKLEHSMQVNYYGAVYPVMAVLPHMRAQKSGSIVFVTSINGKKGVPPDAPYAAAKFALTGFAEVLRQELKPHGIYVSNILPGRVDTALIENLRVPLISYKISPEQVAKAIIYAIRRRKPEVITPFYNSLLVYLNYFSPTLGDWIVRTFHLEGWEEPPKTD